MKEKVNAWKLFAASNKFGSHGNSTGLSSAAMETAQCSLKPITLSQSSCHRGAEARSGPSIQREEGLKCGPGKTIREKTFTCQ